MTLLSSRGATKEFDGLTAVDDVDVELEAGNIYSLIGPNGAGKTTLFNLITGYHSLTEGSIEFNGEDITDLEPAEVNGRGIARTFQLVRPFEGMSVYDNVKVGALFGRTERDADEVTEEALRLTGLDDRRNMQSRNLAVAGSKLLEIAKAVATEPELLLVDEPTAGLNQTETAEVLDILETLVEDGVTIWLVEHDMDAVMNVSDHIFVLDGGAKIAEGPPEEVANNERVIEAYLGSEFAEQATDDAAGDEGGEA